MKIYIIELGEGLETTRAILSTPTRTEPKIGDIVKVEVNVSSPFSLIKTIPIVFYGKIIDYGKSELTTIEIAKEKLSIIREIVNNNSNAITEQQKEISRLNLELGEAQRDRDNYKKAYENLKELRRTREQKSCENVTNNLSSNKEEPKTKETKDKKLLEDYVYEYLKEIMGLN